MNLPSPGQRIPIACERVARYVDEHFREPLTAQRLSMVAHLSEFYLQRAFLQTLGLTVGDYLRRRRLEHSMALLASEKASLELVARASGLGSAAALVHFYRRELGVTPGEFRRSERTASLAELARLPESRGSFGPSQQGGVVLHRPVTPVLARASGGLDGRGYSHVGFSLADLVLAEYHRLYPGNPLPPVISVYPDGASLAPSDTTCRVVLCVPLPRDHSRLPSPGFLIDHLPGGAYLSVPVVGSHRFAWQAWSRATQPEVTRAHGLKLRTSAFPLEVCEGFMGAGDERERRGVSILLPVELPDTAPALAAQARSDLDCLHAFRPRPGQLFERLWRQGTRLS